MSPHSKYCGKLFSVLGDSISTLCGYSIPEDAVFYESVRRLDADVFLPEDTWWGAVIERLGGRLAVNNSYSGSMVCKHPDCLIPSYGCSEERTSGLHREELVPDVIMVFMGVNDWGRGMKPLPELDTEADDLKVFSVAYERMLRGLRKSYPLAEVYCLTLPSCVCSRREDFVFPYSFGGIHIEKYCSAIRATADACGCRVVDLYSDAEPCDTLEGFHPNRVGMMSIADAVLCEMQK